MPADFEAYSQHTYDAARNSSGQGERLIFVGGAPRSGTTLVQNMLDCHEEIYGGPEFLHIPDIVHVRSKLHASIARRWIDLICSYEQVDKMTAAWIEDFLLPLADAQRARFLSEKTPENVLVFPQLIELFPKARFIFVVRDPRAVVSSLLEVGARARTKGRKPPFFTKNLAAAVAYTWDCIEKGFKAVEAAPERVYMVVYERLVREPQEVTKALCDFLQIAWEPSMLRPASKKHAEPCMSALKLALVKQHRSRQGHAHDGCCAMFLWRECCGGSGFVMILEKAYQATVVSRITLQMLPYRLDLSMFQPVIQPLIVAIVESLLLQFPFEIPVRFSHKEELPMAPSYGGDQLGPILSRRLLTGPLPPRPFKDRIDEQHCHIAPHAVALCREI